MTNLIAAAAFLVSLIIVALLMIYPVKAQGWPESEWRKPAQVQQLTRPRNHFPPVSKGWKRKKRHTHGRHPAATVKAWRKLEAPLPFCGQSFSVAGEIKANESRAKDSAFHQWHGVVKWTLGERWADIQHAKNPKFECARSSSETLTQKTMEALGQDIYRYRCSLVATACKPPVVK